MSPPISTPSAPIPAASSSSSLSTTPPSSPHAKGSWFTSPRSSLGRSESPRKGILKKESPRTDVSLSTSKSISASNSSSPRIQDQHSSPQSISSSSSSSPRMEGLLSTQESAASSSSSSHNVRFASLTAQERFDYLDKIYAVFEGTKVELQNLGHLLLQLVTPKQRQILTTFQGELKKDGEFLQEKYKCVLDANDRFRSIFLSWQENDNDWVPDALKLLFEREQDKVDVTENLKQAQLLQGPECEKFIQELKAFKENVLPICKKTQTDLDACFYPYSWISEDRFPPQAHVWILQQILVRKDTSHSENRTPEKIERIVQGEIVKGALQDKYERVQAAATQFRRVFFAWKEGQNKATMEWVKIFLRMLLDQQQEEVKAQQILQRAEPLQSKECKEFMQALYAFKREIQQPLCEKYDTDFRDAMQPYAWVRDEESLEEAPSWLNHQMMRKIYSKYERSIKDLSYESYEDLTDKMSGQTDQEILIYLMNYAGKSKNFLFEYNKKVVKFYLSIKEQETSSPDLSCVKRVRLIWEFIQLRYFVYNLHTYLQNQSIPGGSLVEKIHSFAEKEVRTCDKIFEAAAQFLVKINKFSKQLQEISDPSIPNIRFSVDVLKVKLKDPRLSFLPAPQVTEERR